MSTPPETPALPTEDIDSAKTQQHEQRTLLNQIIGYSDLLINEVQEWGRDGLAVDLRKIRAAGQKLLNFDSGPGPSPVSVRRWAVDSEARAQIDTKVVAPGTLLIVDDDADNCELLARRLKQHGHTTHTALSGPEALTLVSNQPIDLILLDMMMPGMDGQEVLKRLKEDPKQRHIPVLMFSAVDDLESVVRCIELGAEDYLPKPCPPVLMQARIGACLTKKRLFEESAQAAPPPGEDDAAEELGLGHSTAAPRITTVRLQSNQGISFDLDYRALIKVFGVIAGIWLLSKAWSIVILLSIALMLVATLSPLVRRMESRFHRNWGIAVVAFSVVGVSAALLSILIPSLVRQGQNFVLQFPRYAQTVEEVLRKWHVPFSTAALSKGFTTSAGPQIIDVASTIVGGVAEVVMVAVLTIYLLIDGPSAQMSLIRLFPRSERLSVRQLLLTAAERVGSYMRGQLLTSLMVGVFSFCLLLACRVPEPVALAVWMAVADAMPLVGLPIGMGPAVLMALTQGPTTALIVAGGYFLYHQFETTVLIPRLYSKTMKMSASAILIAILVGGKLMGVIGALLALPVAAVIPVVLRYIGQWRDRQVDRQREEERQAQR